MRIPRIVLLVWFYEKILKLRIINACSRWYYRRKVKRGMYVLKSLDGMMAHAGYKRQERRQYWRDFVASQKERDKLFERMSG